MISMRVALLHDTGTDTVVERHLAVDQRILEMKVDGLAVEAVDEFGERQVVRRHESDRAPSDERADDAFRTDEPVV